MSFARFFERNLVGWVLDGLDHQHVAGEAEIASFWLNLRAHFGFRAVARTRGLGDGVFHRRDHDASVNCLFTGDGVCDLQKLEPVGANCHSSLSSSGGRPLRPMP
jgi:hypothetical protein